VDAGEVTQTSPFRSIELDLCASNEVARSLYASVGFVEQGRKRRGRELDGGYDDVIVTTRFFEESPT
jgi:hypothetical protein